MREGADGLTYWFDVGAGGARVVVTDEGGVEVTADVLRRLARARGAAVGVDHPETVADVHGGKGIGAELDL